MTRKDFLHVTAGTTIAVWFLLTGSAASAQVTGTGGHEPGNGSASTTTSTLPPNTSEQVKALLSQLSSPDRAQQEQAANQLRRMQREIGLLIIEVAKKQVQEAEAARKQYYDGAAAELTPAEQAKQLAANQKKATVASRTIRLLGESKVEEAIPFFLDNIKFFDPEQSLKKWNWQNRFPCLGALMLLGVPAADATLRRIEEQSFYSPSRSATWGEEILVRTLGPYGAAGYIQDRIDRLKERQKELSYNPPPKESPGKPTPTPIPVRIERLEAVRAHIAYNLKYWAAIMADMKPDLP